MRQQEVFNKIGSIINELNEQYQYLKPLPLPLDDLELELFAANANFLSDHLDILRRLNTALEKGNQAMKNLPDPESAEVAESNTGISSVEPQHFENMPDTENANKSEPQERIENESTAFEFDLTHTDEEQKLPVENDLAYVEETENPGHEVIANIDEEDVPVPQVDLKHDTGNDHFSFIRSTEPDIIRHNLELSEADTFSSNEDEPHQETVAESLAHTENTIKNDEFVLDDKESNSKLQQIEDKPLTFNERIAAQNSNNQQQKTAQPITDLKSAITLNDKLLFVRDLFNGYSLAYSEAIEILNRFDKLEDAERFLAVNYEAKNSWADKPATSEKFHHLLKRRFA